ncbi:MAG: nucleotidyltransferase domain-containing protein [bacterium]
MKIDERLLNDIINKIKTHFHPLKVILFGSYAEGKSKPDSDVDLLVIMKSNERPAKRAIKIRKLCRPRFLSMDILVRTPREIEERLKINDFFIKKIIENGRVVYERKI